MALLAAAVRASALRLPRASVLLRRRPTISSARAISFWSSSSSEDKEDHMASIHSNWASIRVQVDAASALLHQVRLRSALGSAIQSGVAREPAADLPGLLTQIDATTDYFPFEISENKSGDTITLTRALNGEQIKVVVSMPSLDDDNHEKENESSSSSSDENAREDKGEGEMDTSRSTMHLEVTVSKGDGSNLQFTCFADPDKVEIDTMYMVRPTTKEEGDDDHNMVTYDGFDCLDENLQKSFHEYLELRGITPKMMNLLRAYLSGKLRRNHTLWLNNLQDFISRTD
ncbi:unnamed protein product [Alopecurus aequalis]